MSTRKVDLVVVGGGIAGIAAAIKAREEGTEDVLILERNEQLGGILPQCIHTGFGLQYFEENLTGPEYVSRFTQKIHDLRIGYKLATMVLKITSKKEILASNALEGPFTLQAKSIVLAMGCRERTRGALSIPGTRPAGIFTAGTAQRLMDIEGYLPGRRVVILGSGDVGLIMARRFTMEGVRVAAVVEKMPYAGGLDRNVVQCLEDFDIPLLLNHTVVFVDGRDRVEAVTIAELDQNGKPIPGSEEAVACDTLILSVGLIPENELSRDAGLKLDPRTGGPIVNEYMETSRRGVFACGNVVHVHDLVDHVTLTGELAGRSASKHVAGKLPPPKERTLLEPGHNVRYLVPQIISGERPVTLHLRVTKPAQNVRVEIGDGLSVSQRVVKPPHLVVIRVTEEALKKLEKKDRLVVNVKEDKAR